MTQRVSASIVLITVTIAIACPSTARSQSFNDLLVQLGIKELARDYLRPGVDAAGYSINSALSHRATVDSGFAVWVGGRFITTFIPEADKMFNARLPASLLQLGYPDGTSTATIVGDKGAVLRSEDSEQYPDIQLPDGAGLNSTVLLMPQVNVGAVLGCELLFRGLPPTTFDTDIGKISFYGVGIKHSPTYFLNIPFDLAFIVAWQQFEIGEFVSGNSLAGMAQVSVDAAALTLFGGVGYEAYSIDVDYTYTHPEHPAEPVRIGVDFRRRNLRFSIGAALSILDFIVISTDYSFGIQDNLSIGAGLLF